MKFRTPRNYQGTESPSKKMVDLLPDVLSDIRRKARDPKEEVFQVWFELVGEKMAPLTQPLSFEDQVLTVKVKSSTLYSLLCQHEKPRLLKRLQEKFSIRDLIFRIG